ncbi:MAG: divalent metal cation transporter [Acidobacteria bacterium]|nr:divalent metal cation transporter [Acidobacteriota bacterium]MCA1610704.1 divalent metal cation transporter [Acidobacteriota bacterium]
MKGALKWLLGIVTSICGFIEVGSISTSAQAGSEFGFRLLWAVAIATVCLVFLVEMSGRLALVSGHTLVSAVRERFGFRFHAVPLSAEILLDVLVLSAEIGGACVALQLLTGVSFRWFALPVGLAVWALLWYGTFSVIENGVSALGLVTLAFVVAAWKGHPDPAALLAGLVPSAPPDSGSLPRYGFLAVGILGATISPYLLNFYSSGAVEEKWSEKDVMPNRLVAAFGMSFGSVVSAGVLVVAALVLAPRGIHVDRFEQAALMLLPAFRSWGVPLFAACLFIGCFGAALEIALNLAYAMAQAFGWNWGEDQRPAEDARFCVVYTAAVLAGSVIMTAGLSPLKLTLFSMALTVVVLPLIVMPFLVLLNDPHYVKTHRNGWIGNFVVTFVLLLGCLLAVVVIPLEVIGGG